MAILPSAPTPPSSSALREKLLRRRPPSSIATSPSAAPRPGPSRAAAAARRGRPPRPGAGRRRPRPARQASAPRSGGGRGRVRAVGRPWRVSLGGGCQSQIGPRPLLPSNRLAPPAARPRYRPGGPRRPRCARANGSNASPGSPTASARPWASGSGSASPPRAGTAGARPSSGRRWPRGPWSWSSGTSGSPVGPPLAADWGPISALHTTRFAGRVAGGGAGGTWASSPSPWIRARATSPPRARCCGRRARGSSVGLTGDGPPGPARVLKDAPLEWARATGRPVFVYAFAPRGPAACGPGTAWSCPAPSRAAPRSGAPGARPPPPPRRRDLRAACGLDAVASGARQAEALASRPGRAPSG